MGNIWSQSENHKKDAKWLQDMQHEVNVKKQEKIDITTGKLKKILGRMPNWKSPGSDLIQGFWLKNFSSLHERVRLQLKECVDSGFVPSWLTRERTSLLQKDKSKDNVASNYKAVTCLSLMWKSLTGVIGHQIYAYNVAVIKEVKSRNKNFAMTWIDYKKAYDMVPHSSIIECLDLFGVADNIKSMLVNSMEKWKVMLYSGNFELGEVEIKQVFFKEIL